MPLTDTPDKMLSQVARILIERPSPLAGDQSPKPGVGFIDGSTAPPLLGHAGEVISGGRATAAVKFEAMRPASNAIARSPSTLGSTMVKALRG